MRRASQFTITTLSVVLDIVGSACFMYGSVNSMDGFRVVSTWLFRAIFYRVSAEIVRRVVYSARDVIVRSLISLGLKSYNDIGDLLHCM